MAKGVQAVERACDLLFLIASSDNGLGISQMAAQLGLPKSAVHRLLTSLGSKSMVQQDPTTQRYALSPRVLELTVPFHSQQDIVSIARPFLDQLRDRIQETAVLALRVGSCFMTVTQSPSPYEYRFTPSIGRQLPLHWGAFGKAILAHLPAPELTAFMDNGHLQPATARTIVEPGALDRELEAIRAAGFARSIGEVLEGNIGMAAPILDDKAEPVGCIGLGGPEIRLREFDLDEIGRDLSQAARRVSSALSLYPRS